MLLEVSMSEASTADEDEAIQLTPWGRLKQVYDLASTPVEPGQEVRFLLVILTIKLFFPTAGAG